MSQHDRGAFGALLAEARDLGVTHATWHAILDRDDDRRWRAVLYGPLVHVDDFGRTGEEALRKCVEALRVAKQQSQV